MIKYSFSLLFILYAVVLTAQTGAQLIPQGVTMAVELRPLTKATLTADQEQLRMQMLSQATGITASTIPGADYLSYVQRDSFETYIRILMLNPDQLGISTTVPLYIFQDDRDTLDVWCYSVSLSNPQQFEAQVRQRLFPSLTDCWTEQSKQGAQQTPLTVIQGGRLTVSITSTHAWFLLADFYRDPKSNESMLPDWKVAMVEDSIRMVDSIVAVMYADSVRNIGDEISKEDSMSTLRYNADLAKAQISRDSLYKVVLKDREKRRKKGEQITQSLEDEVVLLEEEQYAKKEMEIDEQNNNQEPEAQDERIITDVDQPLTDFPDQVIVQEPVQVDIKDQEAYETGSYYADYDYSSVVTSKDSLVRRNVNAYAIWLLQLNPEQSMAKHPVFAQLIRQNYDAAYWIDIGRQQQTYWKQKKRYHYEYVNSHNADYLKIRDSILNSTIWKNCGITGGIYYTNNSLVIDQQPHMSGYLADLTKHLFSGKVDRDLLRYVKANPYAAFAVALNPEKAMRLGGAAYNDMMRKQIGAFGFFDVTVYSALLSMNRIFMDKDVVYHLFEGEMVCALTNIVPVTRKYMSYEFDDQFQRKDVEVETTSLVPEFVLAAKIGRKKEMQELIDIAVQSGKIRVANGYYVLPTLGELDFNVYLAFRKDRLILTNDSLLVTSYLKNGYSGKLRLSKKQRKELRKGPLAGWWNIDRTQVVNQKRDNETYDRPNQKTDISYVRVRTRAGLNGKGKIETTITINPENYPQNGFIQTWRFWTYLGQFRYMF